MITAADMAFGLFFSVVLYLAGDMGRDAVRAISRRWRRS